MSQVGLVVFTSQFVLVPPHNETIGRLTDYEYAHSYFDEQFHVYVLLVNYMLLLSVDD